MYMYIYTTFCHIALCYITLHDQVREVRSLSSGRPKPSPESERLGRQSGGLRQEKAAPAFLLFCYPLSLPPSLPHSLSLPLPLPLPLPRAKS